MLKTIKSETGLSLTTSAEYEIAQKWKEDCCSLSASGAKEYKLPDGTAVSLNKASLSQPLECLFDPMLLGLEEQVRQSTARSEATRICTWLRSTRRFYT